MDSASLRIYFQVKVMRKYHSDYRNGLVCLESKVGALQKRPNISSVFLSFSCVLMQGVAKTGCFGIAIMIGRYSYLLRGSGQSFILFAIIDCLDPFFEYTTPECPTRTRTGKFFIPQISLGSVKDSQRV
jgi:hypothetical protein